MYQYVFVDYISLGFAIYKAFFLIHFWQLVGATFLIGGLEARPVHLHLDF